jgi:molecular chaperone GrpE
MEKKEKSEMQIEREESKKAEKNQENEKLSEADEAEGAALLEKILSVLQTSDNPVVENKEAEYLDKIARQQAEFENFRKRTEKEKQENSVNANANLIYELLTVLDNFELSLKHNNDKGVRLIYEELNKVLAKQGLTVIDTKVPFNPNIHEAIIKVDGKQEGVILEELQKGYLLNHKLLRASKVKISKLTEKK